MVAPKDNKAKVISNLSEEEKDAMIGPTGEYPVGKLRDGDKGGLAVAISNNHEKGVIEIEFGTNLNWLGLRPVEARAFAQMLLERADKIEGKR